MDHSALVYQLEVLGISNGVYAVVRELPMFKTRKPEIDWDTS
jgi:hypothetical protein